MASAPKTKIAKAKGRSVSLTAETLRKELRYEPETGLFIRLRTTSSTARIGDIAGSIHGNGYIYVSVLGQEYRAHRLAFLYITGEWPSRLADHRDGDRLNNKWDNLRDATYQQNASNAKKRTDNSSGHKCIRKMRGGWQVRIGCGGSIHVGTFDSLETALTARDAAIEKHFGEFWRAA